MPTIALVDDDRNILAAVAIALECGGYHVVTYADGLAALNGFETNRVASGMWLELGVARSPVT